MKPWRTLHPARVVVRAALLGFGVPMLGDAVIRVPAWAGNVPTHLIHWDELHRLESLIVAGCCMFLGLLTPLRHPIAQRAYAAWLLTTPWRPGKPLPLGSPLPGWRDAVAVAAAVAGCALYCHQSPLLPITGFASGYCIATLALAAVMPWPSGYLVLGLLVAAASSLPHLPAVCAIALVTLAIASVGVRLSLNGYPWKLDQPKLPTPSLGPVFERLSPEPPKDEFTWRGAMSFSLLVGWCTYFLADALQIAADHSAVNGALFFTGMVGCWTALIRWGIYCGQYHPPITTWGRLRTGRLIIPGYDYVLLAPLATAALSVALPAALLHAGLPAPAALAVAAVVILIVALKARPTLSEWRLTGHHRILLNAGSTSTSKTRDKRAAA